jgi:FlaA1/EpsC-like NDP-sugar epimerase
MNLILIPVIDFLAAVGAVYVSGGIFSSPTYDMVSSKNNTALFSGCTSILIFYWFGSYKIFHRYFGSFESYLLVKIVAAFFCVQVFILLLQNSVQFRIIDAILATLILFAVSSLSRIIYSRYSNYREQKFHKEERKSAKNVLIYGAGEAGIQVAAQCNGSSGYVLIGYLDDNLNLQGKYIGGVKIFAPSDIADLIVKFKINEIFIALPSIGTERYKQILNNLSQNKVLLRTLPKLKDIISNKVGLNDIRNLNIEDVLLRDPVEPNYLMLTKKVEGKIVMVTGAGGTIGSELCRTIIKLRPKKLLLIENSEFALYKIFSELNNLFKELNCSELKIIPLLYSVNDRESILECVKTWLPDTIYHAAAYKHVSIVEENLYPGIRNNIWGTWNIAHAALKSGVKDFILISTDKAVRPTSAMGASKRVAELLLQAMADPSFIEKHDTCFSIVRFGNVLGSSGSVVPLFVEQINSGGPVTVRHKEITRYFMTIAEAAQLVLEASALASGGEVYVLDMGKPIKIYELAKKIIELSGNNVRAEFESDNGIEIIFTGLTPGEKLYEELLIGNDPEITILPKIMKAREKFLPWMELCLGLECLDKAMNSYDANKIYSTLKKIVPEYVPSETLVDRLYLAKSLAKSPYNSKKND